MARLAAAFRVERARVYLVTVDATAFLAKFGVNLRIRSFAFSLPRGAVLNGLRFCFSTQQTVLVLADHRPRAFLTIMGSPPLVTRRASAVDKTFELAIIAVLA